jgi:hypothetical protein
MVHFLRCASLFFHVYTDVPLPSGITISGPIDVYKGLTNYLGLPSSLSALLKVPGTTELIDRYIMHSGGVYYQSKNGVFEKEVFSKNRVFLLL